ncbi:sugar ABC transporter ATP-binding protein [Vibrio amylolyticus]|uniref:sugar ABC transporter ATP-binding protein n=1 Tax=Vibrio amylolyticus TaxID=2847292 RepID=UPI003553E34B
MQPVVEMRGIEKYFPGVHALKNINFDLYQGEVHALMGENGAGKSTLMKILSGIYKRDDGDMKIDGKLVSPNTPKEAQDLGVGIVHQELSLMNDLNAAQNVFIGNEPRNAIGILDELALEQRTQQIFDTMNLDISPNSLVNSLSIAKQQLIEIAKVLSHNSKIIVMDEPTAALNDAEVAELFLVIDKLKASGVSIIYISHKMDEIKKVADRITVMRDGGYIGTVSAEQTPIKDIISMMVGREISEESKDIPDTSNNEISLEVKGISREGELNDISFSVRKGEILGFSGLMGSGRTELMRCIFGADKYDSGNIFVHGEQIYIKTPNDAVKAGIGYLSEDRKHFGLATGMTVRTNTVLTSLEKFSNGLGVLNEHEMGATAKEYIESLKIKTPSDTKEVRFLSGGNQQKVVIAKWLLRDCEILIFDEPTRGIDIGAKSEIYKLLEQLAELGKTIIVISSELSEILRLSHRIAVMCEGRLTGILPGGEHTNQEDIMTLATMRD